MNRHKFSEKKMIRLLLNALSVIRSGIDSIAKLCYLKRRRSTSEKCVIATVLIIIYYFYKGADQNRRSEMQDFRSYKMIAKHSTLNIPSLPMNEKIHVAMGLLFVSLDPKSAARAVETISWILVQSSAKIQFHIFADVNSIDTIHRIFKLADDKALVDYDYDIETLDTIYDDLIDHVKVHQPRITLDIFREHLVTQMLPLLFMYHYSSVDKMIFVSHNLQVRSNLIELYNIFHNFSDNNVIGMAKLQNAKYYDSFVEHRYLFPKSKIGRLDGNPGFDINLMLLKLGKMRESKHFQKYLDLESQFYLLKKYNFKTVEQLPNMEEWITLIATESPELIYGLPCQWNVQLKSETVEHEKCLEQPKAVALQ
ncbi:xylosyl- and glucuronyltransferase LARGE2-like [Artemia franciscana]|uniref:Uncharacterized protein n=1 Tax=Artemia franciscana TaxID=6661 RepID=A0AA88LAT9_ARTSF|nr:hypothetical protein QYM36_005064 [Artemia franciscana]